MLRLRPFPFIAGFLLLGGCRGASLTITAPTSFSFNVTEATAPFYQPGSSTFVSNNTLMTVSCANDGTCDALEPPDQEFTLTCVSGQCDPDPVLVEYATDVVDLESIATDYARRVARVELREVRYSVTTNSLNTDLEEVEIYWGPEGASGVGPSDVHLLATTQRIPAMQLVGEESVVLDPAGNAALAQYLDDTSLRIRFFLRSSVDLHPGQPVPSGAFSARLILTIRIRGDFF